MKTNDNKKDFIFSCSTCAFQIEGGRTLGGRTSSIWDEFTIRNYVIPPAGVAGREINSIEHAADFYHKYKTDINIMSNLGLNGFIYNMDWTRVFPKNGDYVNPEGIKWHYDLFENLNKNSIEPIPILFHWDTPLWAEIKGGWENPEILIWFRNYCREVFKYLGKFSNIWYVNDENSTFTLSAYLSDYLPPAKNNKESFVIALHHLNLSGAIAKEEFDKAKKLGYVKKDALLGLVHDWNPPIPYTKNDMVECSEYNSWFKNLWLDPNFKGTYPKEYYEWMKNNDINYIISKKDTDYLKKNKLDLIGWNYYRPCYVTNKNSKISKSEIQKPSEEFFDANFLVIYPKKNVKYTNWNWIIDPSQLEVGAKILEEEYQVPLMIVENGMGEFDDKSQSKILDINRVNYLKDHIAEVLRAKENGVNFIGYSMWTYCDIFSPSGGYRKDYGLVSVDFNSPIKERKPKLSYSWYKQVIKSDGKNLEIDIKKLENDLENELDNWDIFKQ